MSHVQPFAKTQLFCHELFCSIPAVPPLTNRELKELGQELSTPEVEPYSYPKDELDEQDVNFLLSLAA
jgi:hypothetical protein